MTLHESSQLNLVMKRPFSKQFLNLNTANHRTVCEIHEKLFFVLVYFTFIV